VLGLFIAYKAMRKHKVEVAEVEAIKVAEREARDNPRVGTEWAARAEQMGAVFAHVINYDDYEKASAQANKPEPEAEAAAAPTKSTTTSDAPRKRTFCEKMRERFLIIVVGIIHGAAGPGGILGVLPSVQLHDWNKAMLYLAAFCFASNVTMVSQAGGGRVV